MNILQNIYDGCYNKELTDLLINNIYIHNNNNNINIDILNQEYENETNYYNKKYIYLSLMSIFINTNIFEQHGGNIIDINTKYKLNKYGTRLVNDKLVFPNNKKYQQKYNLYLQKYKYYDYNYINLIAQNNYQIGGLYYTRTDSNSNMNAINTINNPVEIDIANIDCNNLQDNEVCIDNLYPTLRNRPEYHKNLELYNFKRYFKGISTDNYMATLYNDFNNDYIKLTYFVYIHLNLALSHFIYILNKTNPHYNIDDNDIHLIYKGGNTTRIHLYAILSRYNSRDLLNRYDQTSIGDWDYNIKINYESLFKKQIQINLFLLKIKKVLGYILSYIKQVFLLCLPNVYNQYARRIIDNLQNTQHIVDKYIESYNNYANGRGDPNITNFAIRNIIIHSYPHKINCDHNYQIGMPYNIRCTHNNDKNMQDNTNIQSYKIYRIDTDNNRSKDLNKSVNNFDYLNLGDLNEIFIAYSDLIDSKAFKYYNAFSLFRLKINNTLNYSERINHIDNEKKLNIPVELIDVSINLIQSNLYDVTQLNMKLFNFHNEYSIYNFNLYGHLLEIELPSIEYMCIDICNILFISTIFPWLDNKYGKRLDRFYLLYILNQLNNNNNNYILTLPYYLTKIMNTIELLLIKFKAYIIDDFNHIMDIRDIVNINNRYNDFFNYINNVNINQHRSDELSDILIRIYNMNIRDRDIVTQVHIKNLPGINERLEIRYINIKLLENNDLLLNYVLSNLYSCIVFLIYLLNDHLLEQNHRDYCNLYFQKYIDCDLAVNPNCQGLSGYIYNIDSIRNNYINHIKELIKYVLELRNKININIDLFRDIRINKLYINPIIDIL